MIGVDIVKTLKTITAVTDIFSTQIYFGSVVKMKTGPFLYVSNLSSNPLGSYTELGPLEYTENFQFVIVGEVNTTENSLLSWAKTIRQAMGMGCNRLQLFNSKRVFKFYQTTMSPVIYQKERPTITVDYTFTTNI